MSWIWVGRTDWIRSLPPPNRAGGSPAHGSPVDGVTATRVAKLTRWARNDRMPSARTTCMGTCGNGWRIAGTIRTPGRPRMARLGFRVLAADACFGVATGMILGFMRARRSALSISACPASTFSVSASPETCDPLHFVVLPFAGAPGDGAPWRRSFEPG